MSNKWETAPSSLKDLRSFMKGIFYMFDVDVNYRLLDKVLDDYNELEAKYQEACKTISRCKDEIDDKDKLIEELKQKNEALESKNKSLDFKYRVNRAFGLTGHIASLNKKIESLEKRNKDLKDLLERNDTFGRYVGNRIAESIREGWEHNLYRLHPYTRIDIHVEEIKDLPLATNNCAIPNISVMFNNTQTEMERDTAQHECEELNEKIKELMKKNKDLKTTLAMCERDANTARKLCVGIAFHAEHARNETPWFINTYEEEK